MNGMMPSSMLAVGLQDIIPVIFVLIGIVSWILNAIKEKSQENARAPRPQPRRPPKRDDSLQNEIDIFIQEVTEQRGERPAPRPQPQAQRPAPQPVPQAPPRRLTPQPRPVSTSPPSAARPASQPIHVRPGQEIASRQGPGSKDLGAALTRHVEQRMRSHSIADETERRLGHNVDASVAAHLGISSTAPAPIVPVGSTMITEVRNMLTDPATVGQAIILNEILGPPRSRRFGDS